jgi:hypothetical protein
MRGNTDTYIYRRGSSPNTRVAISQKNRVWSTPYTTGTPTQKQVGVLATFDWSESRGIDPVRGVGFGDKIQELVPNVTEPMTLTLNRTLLYTAGIVQEVGYKGGVDGMVRSLRQHKWPFDIRQELVFSELVTNFDQNQILVVTQGTDPGTLALITYYEACWLNSMSASYPSDSAIVIEDASATCTDVTDGTTLYGTTSDTYGDLLDSGNNPLLGQGSRLFTAQGGQALGF